MSCLISPDDSYIWTLAETLELLMDEHFPGYKKPEMTQQGSRETGNGYKPRDWALAAKIIYPQGVKLAISTFKPFKAAGPDGI